LYLYNLNIGESARVSFNRTDDTSKILFYESVVKEGGTINNYPTSIYGQVALNTLPASFEGLTIEAFSISNEEARIRVKNNTGKAVSDISCLIYRCFNAAGDVIGESVEYVNAMDSGETSITTLGYPNDTVKIMFYGAKVKEGTASGNVNTVSNGGIMMNALPYSSNGIELRKATVDGNKIIVSTVNNTGSSIKSSSGVSYKCYDANGYVEKSGMMYLNNMNAGDLYDAVVYKTDETKKIVFYNFKVSR